MTYSASSPILGTGTISAEAINAWYAARGPKAAESYAPDRTYKPAPADLGQLIIEESRRWPSHVVNHDLIAADIAHESAFWQSRIVRDKHNPSGLGAVNDNAYAGAVTFLSPREGIRATVAHMLSYAVGDGPWASSDPRFGAVRAKGWLGTAPTLGGLNGKWAHPGTTYGQQIAAAANALVEFANNGSWNMAAQIPGFTWHPADSNHFQRGRTEQIRGGAQHYTAGTNSLAWLSTTPGTEVSATFLVKHNPTLEDRGWQLVRIEDTAWTTAFANPYTVSIEYEHNGTQAIPDIAYEVLAITWAEISRYVTKHGLGEITTIAGHKTWVNNPQLVCPDGIDIGRIVTRWNALMKGDEPPPTDWPKVPTTERDPWRPSNPWGKDKWIPRVFVDRISGEGFMASGYVLTEAFAEDDKIVQYFERKRWELHRDGTVTAGLVGLEALVARYPERAP